jgi:hypothetical protein
MTFTLIIAAEEAEDIEVMKLLVEAGVDVQKEVFGLTTLDACVRFASKKSLEMLQYVYPFITEPFLLGKAIFECIESSVITRAHTMYEDEYTIHCVKYLHERGGGVNYVDHKGDSALHIVAGVMDMHLPCEDIRDFLLFNGADYNLKNNRGETPLSIFERRGDKESLEVISSIENAIMAGKTIGGDAV